MANIARRNKWYANKGSGIPGGELSVSMLSTSKSDVFSDPF
eukprot:CAMPEP_0183736148 /NCGR_PEP_ID=MMETSP0737-20130205/48611_1 /TAXON_ID=385413 /ORGANISM="Thalassiosira miniscula, Strain CCMP1093" /LENGTH=40 /DNA_ID= /DNA_START= /DNA_END= /DNA_ORIENTATION=